MQEELKRINSIGDVLGICHFSSVVLKGETKKDAARQICSFRSGMRIVFDAAVALFEYIGLITLPNKQLIRPTEKGLEIGEFENSNDLLMAICRVSLAKLFFDAIIDYTAFSFDPAKECFYIKKHAFPLSAAVFRNLLIMSGALLLRDDEVLEITKPFEMFFIDNQKKMRKQMTLAELHKKLEIQEQQGEVAELFVVEYEKWRLGVSFDTQKVKRISEIDVLAGYDIVSYENSSSDVYDRFIEVKSFVGNMHFYWSQNEISSAERYADKYYLYIIDIEKINTPYYHPTIIKNPAKLINESETWIMNPVSYLVLQTLSLH